MSLAVSGVGTVFQRDGVALAEVNSITGPTMTRDFIDVTSLDSTGGYREFIAGFRDAGTISLSMNFTATTYAIIKADFEDPLSHGYTIILGDTASTQFDFEGLVTECPLTIPTDDKITADVTIKITGKVFMLGIDSTGGA
jgi:predicted secreted protein